ncbi:MAG: hypothetical protein HYX75_20420 [Acidobacteria bacterium]|nr:hypothetical protein [Acidobacteriota bacterium]
MRRDLRRWVSGCPGIAIIAAVAIPFLPSLVEAQGVSWSRRWGASTAYEAGWGVGLDGAGNLYTGGYSLSYGAGNRDFLLLMHDSSGALQWAKTWGGAFNEYGYDLDLTATSILMCGRSSSFALSFDAVVAKFDLTGTLVWARTWGVPTSGESATGVAQDGAGNVYVSGYTDDAGANIGAGGYDLFLLKYDSAGTLQWTRTWGGTNQDWGWFNYSPDIAVDSSGNCFVTAGTFSYGSNPGVYQDAVVIKYNTNGTVEWARTWGEPTVHEEGQAIALDSSGNICVAGVRNSASYSYTGGAQASNHAFILMLDSSGTPLWSRQIDTGTLDFYSSLSLDGSNNIYATGRYYNDALVAKFTNAGEAQWSRAFGGSGLDIGQAGTASGLNYYVVGYDASTDMPLFATLSPTVTDTSSVTAASATGIETIPAGIDQSVTGIQTTPAGLETGSASVDVMILDVLEDGPPDPPVGISPSDGAQGVSRSPLLVAGPYSDTNGDPPTDAEWMISTDYGGSRVVYDAVSGMATQTHTVASTLSSQTPYFWLCRYKDDHGNWGAWSTPIMFRTGGTRATTLHAVHQSVSRPQAKACAYRWLGMALIAPIHMSGSAIVGSRGL